jgi:hypothetical protein
MKRTRQIVVALSTESQIKFADAGVMPVISPVFDEPSVAESSLGPEMKEWADYAAEYENMEKLPEDWNLLAEMMAKAAQEIVFNDAPIMETLQQAEDDYMAQHNE